MDSGVKMLLKSIPEGQIRLQLSRVYSRMGRGQGEPCPHESGREVSPLERDCSLGGGLCSALSSCIFGSHHEAVGRPWCQADYVV